VFTRFPGLKATLAESGAAWVPALLDRLHYMEGHAGTTFRKAWADHELTPSEVLLRNFWFCAFDDYSAIEARHRIGVGNLLLEVDYPHSDSTWPDSQLHTRRLLKGVADEDVRNITHGNAAALFRHPLPAGR
jgi:hypothetical protein